MPINLFFDKLKIGASFDFFDRLPNITIFELFKSFMTPKETDFSLF